MFARNKILCVARLFFSLFVGAFVGYWLSQLSLYEPKNISLADQLKDNVRVLCWVMTHPHNHKRKAIHIKRTWGKRCNILLFMSSEDDDELPTVNLHVEEGRENLWRKVKEAFKYVYKHHYNDADWFYKADDDTYAVVENLRYMLYPYHPETPVYFGFRFKPFVKQGYMSGGPGYVLSREALRRFVVEGIPNPKICGNDKIHSEDVRMGKCMENLKVTAGDSRDAHGQVRMYPFKPKDYYVGPSSKYWFYRYTYYNMTEGLNSLSKSAISFHYILPEQMYTFDYLLYRLKTYGIADEPWTLPSKLAVDEFMPEPTTTEMQPTETK